MSLGQQSAAGSQVGHTPHNCPVCGMGSGGGRGMLVRGVTELSQYSEKAPSIDKHYAKLALKSFVDGSVQISILISGGLTKFKCLSYSA